MATSDANLPTIPTPVPIIEGGKDRISDPWDRWFQQLKDKVNSNKTTGIFLSGWVATYAALPPGPMAAGTAYLNKADGLIYVWSGTAFQPNGQGLNLQGPVGPQGPSGAGATGPQGATGAQGVAGATGSASTTFSVTQTAHGFVVGTPISRSTTGPAWVAASNIGGLLACDAIVSTVVNANTFLAQSLEGSVITLTTGQWDAITGGSGGLVDGEYYFLGVSGHLARAKPSNYVQVVLKAISTTQAVLSIGDMVIIGSVGGGSGTFNTTTTGPFTIASIGSPQTVPVLSVLGASVGNFIYLTDITHTIVGQITAIAAPNLTVTTFAIFAGSVGNTMATGAAVSLNAYPGTPTSGTTGQFLRGDGIWSNAIVGASGLEFIYGSSIVQFVPLNTISGVFWNGVTGALIGTGDPANVVFVQGTIVAPYNGTPSSLGIDNNNVGTGNPQTEGLILASNIARALGVRTTHGPWQFAYTIPSTSGAITLDLVNGAYQRITPTGVITFIINDTTPAPTASGWQFASELTLEIVGNFAVTWPGSITWINGASAPVLTPGTNLVRLVRRQGMSGWLGYVEISGVTTYSDTQARSAVLQTTYLVGSSTVAVSIVPGTSATFSVPAGSIGATQIANASIPISKFNVGGTPSGVTYLDGTGNWSVPAGGGGTLIQMAVGSINFGTLGQYTKYNFNYGFSLSGASSTLAINPNFTQLQAAINFGGGAGNTTTVQAGTGIGLSTASGITTITNTGGGGGGTSIQFERGGTAVGAPGQYNTYNFTNDFSLTGPGAIIQIAPNFLTIQQAINFGSTGIGAVGTITPGSGIGFSLTGSTLTITASGGGGSTLPAVSPSVANFLLQVNPTGTGSAWVGSATNIPGNFIFVGTGTVGDSGFQILPSVASSFGSGTFCQITHGSSTTGGNSSFYGIHINAQDNNTNNSANAQGFYPFAIDHVCKPTGSITGSGYGAAWIGQRVLSAQAGAFSVAIIANEQHTNLTGGDSSALFFTSTGPNSYYSATAGHGTDPLVGVFHAMTGGTVRVGEVNYGNAWADPGMQETRGIGPTFFSGIEFFPQVQAGLFGTKYQEFPCNWAIAIGNSGANATRLNTYIAQNYIGILLDKNGLTPGGYGLKLWGSSGTFNGNSATTNAPHALIKFSGTSHIGLDFAGTYDDNVPLTATDTGAPVIVLSDTTQSIKLGPVWIRGATITGTPQLQFSSNGSTWTSITIP